MSFPFQTPPPCFFTINGIFAERYSPYVKDTFDYISTIVSIDSSGILPDPFNNRFESTKGKYFSFQQLEEYDRQIALFQRVYAYNSNQYFTQTKANPARPFKFCTYKEFNDFRSATGIINKLYNVNEGLFLTDIFILPFPPFTASFPPPP
jgi:hypothetical protein